MHKLGVPEQRVRWTRHWTVRVKHHKSSWTHDDLTHLDSWTKTTSNTQSLKYNINSSNSYQKTRFTTLSPGQPAEHLHFRGIGRPDSCTCFVIYQPAEFSDTRTDNMEQSADTAVIIRHDVASLQAWTEDAPLPVDWRRWAVYREYGAVNKCLTELNWAGTRTESGSSCGLPSCADLVSCQVHWLPCQQV